MLSREKQLYGSYAFIAELRKSLPLADIADVYAFFCAYITTTDVFSSATMPLILTTLVHYEEIIRSVFSKGTCLLHYTLPPVFIGLICAIREVVTCLEFDSVILPSEKVAYDKAIHNLSPDLSKLPNVRLISVINVSELEGDNSCIVQFIKQLFDTAAEIACIRTSPIDISSQTEIILYDPLGADKWLCLLFPDTVFLLEEKVSPLLTFHKLMAKSSSTSYRADRQGDCSMTDSSAGYDILPKTLIPVKEFFNPPTLLEHVISLCPIIGNKKKRALLLEMTRSILSEVPSEKKLFVSYDIDQLFKAIAHYCDCELKWYSQELYLMLGNIFEMCNVSEMSGFTQSQRKTLNDVFFLQYPTYTQEWYKNSVIVLGENYARFLKGGEAEAKLAQFGRELTSQTIAKQKIIEDQRKTSTTYPFGITGGDLTLWVYIKDVCEAFSDSIISSEEDLCSLLGIINNVLQDLHSAEIKECLDRSCAAIKSTIPAHQVQGPVQGPVQDLDIEHISKSRWIPNSLEAELIAKSLDIKSPAPVDISAISRLYTIAAECRDVATSLLELYSMLKALAPEDIEANILGVAIQTWKYKQEVGVYYDIPQQKFSRRYEEDSSGGVEETKGGDN